MENGILGVSLVLPPTSALDHPASIFRFSRIFSRHNSHSFPSALLHQRQYFVFADLLDLDLIKILRFAANWCRQIRLYRLGHVEYIDFKNVDFRKIYINMSTFPFMLINEGRVY